MDDNGEDLKEHLVNKYGPGITRNIGDPNSALSRMGRQVGISFQDDRRIYPTIMAHALIEEVKATDNDKANLLMEEMYKEYFEKAANINDIDKLIEVASKFAIPADTVRQICTDQAKRKEILLADTKAKQGGVHGVPFFKIYPKDGSPPTCFSGAQPVDIIAEQLQLAADE